MAQHSLMIRRRMKIVKMAIIAFPRHVQGLRTRGGCLRMQKNPRKVVTKHKKGQKFPLLVLEMHDKKIDEFFGSGQRK